MNNIKHNLFDENTEIVEDVISHSEMNDIVSEFMSGEDTSLEGTFLQHGITNIETLFPEPKQVGEIETVDVKDDWCAKVVNGVKHVPFEKTKSEHFDITGEEARALGYIKGNFKKEEQIAVMKRTTEATMVYKKQSLDKDDEIEMDFDLLKYYRGEMRKKLIQENARAILFGDGRPALINDDVNPDKIREDRIRPVWTDAEFYSVHHVVDGVTSASTMAQKATAFIDEVVKASDEYEGSGSPTLFADPRLITACLLLKDGFGHRIYKTMSELASAMDVSSIVKVEPMKQSLRRTDGQETRELAAILVNLNDYVVGTNGKGQTKFYDQFDIHYNKTYLLLENRFSGALVKHNSAVCFEFTVSDDVLPNFTVTPIPGTTTMYGKLVSELQDGVRVTDIGVVGNLNYVTGYTGYSGDAALQSGHFLALHCDCIDDATTTIELVGGSGSPVAFTSDDKDAVVRITDTKKQYLKFISTVEGGRKIVKKFTLNGLNFVD